MCFFQGALKRQRLDSVVMQVILVLVTFIVVIQSYSLGVLLTGNYEIQDSSKNLGLDSSTSKALA